MHRLLLLVFAACVLACLPSSAAATHTGDLDCSDFADQAAAQHHLAAHPGDPDGLDGNADGRACESRPCPCEGTTPPQPPVTGAGRARIVRVIDGDTLKVRLATGSLVTVRLIGIDTPETRKPGTRVECGGRDATARMKKLAFRNGIGRAVMLKTDPTQDSFDRYGRLLANVSAGSVDLGRSMISSGWAKVYVFRRDFQGVVAYRSAQRSAKAARRGVWRDCGGNFHRGR